jgi:hypothetical protein
MVNTGIRRSDMQIQWLMDQIFKLQVEGYTPKEIQDKLKLPVRTYEHYYSKLQERIIAEEAVQRREDILYHKKVAEDRITWALRGLREIADNQKVSARTRMDSYHKSLDAVGLMFRLHLETGNWLAEYNKLQIPRRVEASEILEEAEPLGEAVVSEPEVEQPTEKEQNEHT